MGVTIFEELRARESAASPASSPGSPRPPGAPLAAPRAPATDFDGFVRATGRSFHRAALLLTGGDHHLAEDLLQTTYAKVFASWRRVRRADDPVAYARTMLTRTFLSHRRLRRSGEMPTDRVVERAEPGTPDPALTVDLVVALGQLSPRDRAVVVLRYWLDRSVTQTAAELGMSEPAVRTAARRALARLRVHLIDPDDCENQERP